MPVGDLWQFTAMSSISNQRLRNVLYYETLSVVGADLDALTIGEAIYDNIDGAWRDCCSLLWNFDGFRTQRIKPTLGVPTENIGKTAPGTVLGEAEPEYVAAVITLLSAIGGRKARGRKFIGGLSETSVAGSVINPAALALLSLLAATLEDEVTASDGPNASVFAPVIYSRKFNQTFLIVDSRANPRTGTTNTRKVGRGE